MPGSPLTDSSLLSATRHSRIKPGALQRPPRGQGRCKFSAGPRSRIEGSADLVTHVHHGQQVHTAPASQQPHGDRC